MEGQLDFDVRQETRNQYNKTEFDFLTALNLSDAENFKYRLDKKLLVEERNRIVSQIQHQWNRLEKLAGSEATSQLNVNSSESCKVFLSNLGVQVNSTRKQDIESTQVGQRISLIRSLSRLLSQVNRGNSDFSSNCQIVLSDDFKEEDKLCDISFQLHPTRFYMSMFNTPNQLRKACMSPYRDKIVYVDFSCAEAVIMACVHGDPILYADATSGKFWDILEGITEEHDRSKLKISLYATLYSLSNRTPMLQRLRRRYPITVAGQEKLSRGENTNTYKLFTGEEVYIPDDGNSLRKLNVPIQAGLQYVMYRLMTRILAEGCAIYGAVFDGLFLGIPVNWTFDELYEQFIKDTKFDGLDIKPKMKYKIHEGYTWYTAQHG